MTSTLSVQTTIERNRKRSQKFELILMSSMITSEMTEIWTETSICYGPGIFMFQFYSYFIKQRVMFLQDL